VLDLALPWAVLGGGRGAAAFAEGLAANRALLRLDLSR
jgi:hypothetical protein